METLKILGLVLILFLAAIGAWRAGVNKEAYDLSFLDSLIRKSPLTKQYKQIICHELKNIRVSFENEIKVLELNNLFEERFKDVSY
jgi:hypothetical protein